MGRRKQSSLGRAIVKKQFSGSQRRGNEVAGVGSEHQFKHVVESNEGVLASITEASDIDELLVNAQMSGREFEVEHERAVVLDKRVYLAHVQDTPPQHQLGVLGTAKGEAGASLPIPLRPAWHRGMKADELHARERETFLEWRRTLVHLEEESGVLLTPYEKNLEVWRQLWRVVERSDVVLQIVDARNPLLFYCPSLDEYVKNTPRVMGEPTERQGPVEDHTHTLLLINKSDFLSLEQRKLWSAYLKAKNIPFIFFSAHIAAEQEEEAARLAETEEAKQALEAAGTSVSPRFARRHREVMEKHNDEMQQKQNLVNAKIVEEQRSAAPVKAEKQEETEAQTESDHGEGNHQEETEAQTESDHDEESDSDISTTTDAAAGAAAPVSEGSSPAGSSATIADTLSSVDVSEESTRVLSRDQLIEYLLKTYLPLVGEPKDGQPRQLMVGMVGYPNVGKSSTINVLYGTKKTTVSSTPGKTKHFQTLRVSLEESPHEADDLELWLCDCPGLVFPSLVSTKAHMVVNGLLPIDTLRDYRGPISLLCTRIPRWMWLDSYGLRLPMPPDHLPENEPPSVDELLQAYGMLRGFMNSHGTADAGRTARTLLKDYVDGIKLLYCAPPPPIVDEESLALTPEQCAQRAKDYNLLGTRQEANASKVEKRSAVQMQRTRKVAGLDDFLNQQNIRAHQTRLHGMTRGRTALSRAGGRGGGQLPSKKANRRGGGRVKRWDQV